MQRVDQLKYDARHLKAAQENLKRKRDERRAHERNREVNKLFPNDIYIHIVLSMHSFHYSIHYLNKDLPETSSKSDRVTKLVANMQKCYE